MKGRKLGALEKIAYIAVGVGLAFSPLVAKAKETSVKLTNTFVGSNYTPDSFKSAYDPANSNLSDDLDLSDVEQAPNYTDWNFLQMYTVDTGTPLTEDYKAFDPSVDKSTSWAVNLVAEDYALMQGFTGTSRITIDNPDEIDEIPSDFNVYMKRFDKDGQLKDTYNLRDPDNYSIDWNVGDALGKFGSLELIVNKPTNAADINDDGVVNLQDFSYISKDWLKNSGVYSGDVTGDGNVDMDDLNYFSNNWMWDRKEVFE